MQIDFHFYVTYILARLAGFNHNDANIISTSAQYVDDNNYKSVVRFDNCAIYSPIISSHKKLDYTNFDDLANHLVWIPFHFLPGNCQKRADEIQEEVFSKRLICLADSIIANEMVDECIEKSFEPNALYRLGITMHVYADTWAHKGFSGICNESNSVRYSDSDDVSKNLIRRIEAFFGDGITNVAGLAMALACPLGHGSVLSYPDLPYLKWRYIDYTGNLIVRNNPSEYLEAANKMYVALKRFRGAKAEPLGEKWSALLLKYFTRFNDADREARCDKWETLLAKGAFGLHPIEVEYDKEGWEYIEDFATFESSNWKRFNDALKDHHYYLTCKLFPKYGLCAC